MLLLLLWWIEIFRKHHQTSEHYLAAFKFGVTFKSVPCFNQPAILLQTLTICTFSFCSYKFCMFFACLFFVTLTTLISYSWRGPQVRCSISWSLAVHYSAVLVMWWIGSSAGQVCTHFYTYVSNSIVQVKISLFSLAPSHGFDSYSLICMSNQICCIVRKDLWYCVPLEYSFPTVTP